MIADECGCPGPDSGSRDSGGGKVVAASGGGDSGVTACSGGDVRTGGIRNFAQISAQISAQQPRQGSFRRDWNAVVCFSCGKAGHSATRCPTLDDSFPFMLPGWTAEKTAGSYAMISPRVAAERRRAENGD